MTKSTPVKLLCLALLLTLFACGAPKPKKAGGQAVPLQNYEQAAEKYTKALKDDPDSVTLLTELGFAYYNLGQYDEAIAQYTHALEIQDYAKASFYLGLATIAKGERAAGLKMLENFRYVGRIRVTEAIQAKARELSARPELNAKQLAEQFFNAWDEGLAEDKKATGKLR